MDRLTLLRARLTKDMAIVEIGPSHNPVLPKRDGWRTTVVDHASRTDLSAKYADHGIDLSKLEEVDIVWSGGDLAALFPSEALASYDAIFASHVIEHMPDPVSFLESAQRLLKPTGIVVLAVPDKRFCFDVFGPLSTAGDWLSAHALQATTHSRRAAFNHVAYSANLAGAISWNTTPALDQLALHSDLRTAAHHFEVATDTGTGRYTDYHAWRFIPSSFQLIMLEIAFLCDLDLHVAACSARMNHEFHAVIERGRDHPNDSDLASMRLDLLRTIPRELAEAVLPAPALAAVPAEPPADIPRRSLRARLMRAQAAARAAFRA